MTYNEATGSRKAVNAFTDGYYRLNLVVDVRH